MGNEVFTKNDTESDTWVTISMHCVLVLLELGLQSGERKTYKDCMGNEFYMKFGTNSDTEGTVATHCILILLDVWTLKYQWHFLQGKCLAWSV